MRAFSRLLLAVLAVYSFSALRREARTRERPVVLAVEADEAGTAAASKTSEAALAGFIPASPAFLERLRALGVAGLVLRPQSLGRLVAGGRAVRFDAEEVARMKAAGLAPPEVPLGPGTLFVKDEAVRARLEAAARAQGVALSETRHGRNAVLSLPAGTSPEAFSAGFDPEAAAAAARAGLVPVYRVGTDADLRLALEAPDPAALLLEPPRASPALAQALAERRRWMVPGEGPRTLSFVELGAEAPVAELLRGAAGAGPTLAVLRLREGMSRDAAAAALRRLARGLRAEGRASDWPSGLFEPARRGAAERAVRRALSLLLAVGGALWALRAAVAAARRLSRAKVLPEAAPVREALGGLVVVTLAAAAAGACARAVAGGAEPWSWAVLCAVAAGGFVGFWVSDTDSWKDRKVYVRLVLAALGTAFILRPPEAGASSAFGLSALASWKPSWWWAPARWPEIVVGVPALFTGLCLYVESLAQKPSEARDARPWLFAGLTAPAGAVMALSNPGVPFEQALLHTTHCLAAGLPLGAALWLLASRRTFAGKSRG